MAEGVHDVNTNTQSQSQQKGPMFKLGWDETFFAGLDKMDCTEPERAALQTLQQDLLNTRGLLE
eukprot:6669992-Pyramimonas_sp.AAC.1